MPFTFYFEAKNKPVLFVFDAKPNEDRSSRAVFVECSERISKNTYALQTLFRNLPVALI
jgi:hypothetical protein